MYRQRAPPRQESIYSLIPPQKMAPAKPPMYKSKFQVEVPAKKDFSSMGRIVGADAPSQFLKAGERTKGTMPAPQAHVRMDESRKASVPSRKEKPIYGLKSSKNYVTANAVENILQAPRHVEQTPARMTEREDFGKVPEYLQRIKQERNQEDDFIRQVQAARREEQAVKILPESDRLEILEGLKRRWAELNKTYIQKTSFAIGTERARIAKESLEAELTQVEKDIEKMSKRNIVIQEPQYGYY